MRQLKLVSTVLMTSVLAACGGGGGDVPAKPKFTSQVSFGDSLSDVGSYQVGIVAGVGGGQFTINAPASVKAGTPTNWTEMTALKLGLPMPCAAQTGLDNGSGAAPGTPVGTVMPVVNKTNCTGYAQGGSRVTSPVGIGNKLFPGGGFALTVPVVTQIANHLAAHGGSFASTDLVTVMAGANDVAIQAGMVGATYPPASAVAAVQTAATELAAQINTNIVAKGATHVVVVNVPDIASTPKVTSITNPTLKAQTAGLIDTLVKTFNATLKAAVPDSAVVLNVDAYTASKDEVANPAKYNLINVAATACNLAFGVNPFATSGVPASGSSLACNATNLNTGVLSTDRYLFADLSHPTPYGHLLFATYVLQGMTNKGWY
ncbi:MAG: SGNH/GDSL hydrolase family protein [Sideroxydans sp.]|nr:SGNH/GDSL hydrolase family protein [Sideroxydans sp.]